MKPALRATATRHKAPDGERHDGQPTQDEADRGAWQDGVRERVPSEAHAAQHQKGPDRATAQRKCEASGQRAAHEAIVQERRDQACDGAHRSPIKAGCAVLVPGDGSRPTTSMPCGASRLGTRSGSDVHGSC